MELALANAISNLLALLLKSVLRDIEVCFSSTQFFLQTIVLVFSTTWDHLSGKMQISKACDKPQLPLHQAPCNGETFAGEEKISAAEMNAMMSALGMEGVDGDASFLTKDFLSLFEEEEPSLEEIKETFGVFDVNNDGFIDASELQRVVCNLGFKEGCELKDCKRMIKAFDGNGDGLIDFQEFVKFMEKSLC